MFVICSFLDIRHIPFSPRNKSRKERVYYVLAVLYLFGYYNRIDLLAKNWCRTKLQYLIKLLSDKAPDRKYCKYCNNLIKLSGSLNPN